MSAAIDALYPPLDRGRDAAERVAERAPIGDVMPDLWTEVHDEVQRIFDIVECEVRRRAKEVQAHSFRTKGDNFHLFTYRTFSIPNSAIDPVVAGITFSPINEEVSVEADVSGEQTGDSIESLPRETVPRTREKLLGAARELALKLSQSSHQIADAICDRSRTSE